MIDFPTVREISKIRSEILRNYKINERGMISSPGKFESEMLYVPYFWNLGLEGSADRDNGKIFGFDISPEEKFVFPELRGRRTVKLYERDDGFVVEL